MHLLIRHPPVEPALLVLDRPVGAGDRRIDQLGHLHSNRSYGAATTAADTETAIRSQNHRSRHRRSTSTDQEGPESRARLEGAAAEQRQVGLAEAIARGLELVPVRVDERRLAGLVQAG